MAEGPSRLSASSSMTPTSWADDGAKTVMPGIDSVERQVEHAVVAGPVVTGDPGPVEDEDHRKAVQPDVEVGLVEGAAEEGGVDGHHRSQPGHGHAGGGGDGVLLGDAHVEEPVGELGLEGEEPGRAGHGRGDGHDLGSLPGGLEHGAGEGVGVGGRRDRRPTGATEVGLHLEVVQALDVVLLGRGVAPALLGEDVDDDGPAPLRGVGERLLHAGDVVAVDGPGVADPGASKKRWGVTSRARRW